VPHEIEPPWTPSKATLPAIDAHFWDWLLWLMSKEAAGRDDLVSEELAKMFDHLLQPMGEQVPPIDLTAALDAYVNARGRQEGRLDVRVSRRPESEVRRAWIRRSSSPR
jgi:hypothetical protein